MDLELIDRYCDQFEKRLRAGESLTIASFLDEHGIPKNDRLLAELDRLAREYAADGANLGASDGSDLPDTADSPSARERPRQGDATNRLGQRIGPYKLLQVIGEGGMGSVYLAEQSEPVRRQIALKVIKPGMDSRQVVARFEAERQALSLMDHPHIARVLDAGETADGLPYFVMELVKGLPITKYCDEHRLTPRQRLELFIPVCQAIQHAHQKGVIHRDIKPSNILVAEYDHQPVPKVIDFGVAKATSQALTEKTMFTEIGQIIGTLEYMSPEQAKLNQLDIDTRCDIYSLGVVLYELLTGVTPFERKRLKSAALEEVLRIIREEEPQKPSTRLSNEQDTASSALARCQTEPRQLANLLRGELDWIVMKALDKERNRRYHSAHDLARDLARYLDDEPVEAQPPTVAYRLRKFLRRNRAAVAALSAIFATLCCGLIGTSYGLYRAQKAWGSEVLQRQAAEVARANETRAKEAEASQRVKAQQSEQRALESLKEAQAQRDRADRNAHRAREAVNEFLVRVTGDAKLKQAGLHDLRRKLLNAAIPYFEEFLREQAPNAELRNDRCNALVSLGQVRAELGELSQAQDNFAKAIDELDSLANEFPDEPRHLHHLIAAWESYGRNLLDMGNHQDAEQAMWRRVKLSESASARFSNDAVFQSCVCKGLADLGKLLLETGRLDEAERIVREAIAIEDRRRASNPAPRERSESMVAVHNNLALALLRKGQFAEAAAAYRRSIEESREFAERYPSDPEIRRDLASILDQMGAFLAQQQKFIEAEPLLREGVERYERLVTDFADVPRYRYELASCSQNLGTLLMQTRRIGDARTAMNQAIVHFERLTKEFPNVPDYDASLAFAYINAGSLLVRENEVAMADETWRKAMAINERLVEQFPENPQYSYFLAKAVGGLANLAQHRREWEVARSYYRRAIDRLKLAVEKNVDNPLHVQRILTSQRQRLADIDNFLAWGWATHPDAAERNGAKAVEYATEACELSEWKNAAFLDTLAAAYAEQGQFAEAAKRQQAAIDKLSLLDIFTKQAMRQRLELYKSEKPFREESPKQPSPQ